MKDGNKIKSLRQLGEGRKVESKEEKEAKEKQGRVDTVDGVGSSKPRLSRRPDYLSQLSAARHRRLPHLFHTGDT